MSEKCSLNPKDYPVGTVIPAELSCVIQIAGEKSGLHVLESSGNLAERINLALLKEETMIPVVSFALPTYEREDGFYKGLAPTESYMNINMIVSISSYSTPIKIVDYGN